MKWSETGQALLRARSSEPEDRASQVVNSLSGVTEANETKEQRQLRDAGQRDWNASQELCASIKQVKPG